MISSHTLLPSEPNRYQFYINFHLSNIIHTVYNHSIMDIICGVLLRIPTQSVVSVKRTDVTYLF